MASAAGNIPGIPSSSATASAAAAATASPTRRYLGKYSVELTTRRYLGNYRGVGVVGDAGVQCSRLLLLTASVVVLCY